jgi:hypothetical protein
VELSSAGALLDSRPLELEMGVRRLQSGQLLVAARTDMHRCTGEMFEWWFRFAPDTQQYTWWHPIDHVSSAWRETSPSTHIGSTHVISERFGADAPADDLLVQFVDPGELFGADAVADAREAGEVSGIVYGHGGFAAAGLDDAGRPIGVRLLHVARDTPWGAVLRTRFWMGAGLPAEAARELPVEVGLALMQHAYTEFRYLSHFLPSLYIAENRDRVPVALPW